MLREFVLCRGSLSNIWGSSLDKQRVTSLLSPQVWMSVVRCPRQYISPPSSEPACRQKRLSSAEGVCPVSRVSV